MTPKRRRKYKRYEPGEWWHFKRGGQKMACCDCGLVHVFDARLVKGQLWMRGWRDERATGAMTERRRLVKQGVEFELKGKGSRPTTGSRTSPRSPNKV